MQFQSQGTEHTLLGHLRGKLRLMDQEGMTQLLGKSKQLAVLHLCVLEDTEGLRGIPHSGSQEEIAATVSPILTQLDNILSEPQQPPPRRSHDHKIPLKVGASLVNIQPYRYPSAQKHVIEQMVYKMLLSGIIQHSSNRAHRQ